MNNQYFQGAMYSLAYLMGMIVGKIYNLDYDSMFFNAFIFLVSYCLLTLIVNYFEKRARNG